MAATTQVIDTVAAFRAALDGERAAGRSVGLVPTMGALHEGHLSLVRRAAEECDAVALTVFVNPLQFGPREDLAAYPRDLDGDVVKAAGAGSSHVFAPPLQEMFPGPPLTSVTVARLSEGREGESRPGHLTGVATVVTKLFAIAGPCRAYFGEKDHQQLQVVRRLAADLSFPVDVVGCPTAREADGLALSSRNAYLSPEDRAAATVLYRALSAGRAMVEAGRAEPRAVRQAVAEVIRDEERAQLDYAEVAAEEGVAGGWRLFVAARIGTTRLIDNLLAVAP